MAYNDIAITDLRKKIKAIEGGGSSGGGDTSQLEARIAQLEKDILEISKNFRPNLNKTATVSVESFPLAADLIDDGARIQFGNIAINCMCSSGPFRLDIPAGTLDYAHGQKICVDTSTRAPKIIFIQQDWPGIDDETKWAIGTMTTNAVVVDGVGVQRKIVEIFGVGSIARDYA